MNLIKKKWFFVLLIAILAACSTPTKSGEPSEIEAEVKKTETQVLNSVSKAIDTAKEKIDKTSQELDSLLDDISK
ncbi:MAG: hypothetical protein ACK5JD_05605 [Mangrovibacterium sp.]